VKHSLPFRGSVKTHLWTRGHRKEESADTVAERVIIRGNNLGDSAADDGMRGHPMASGAAYRDIDFELQVAEGVLKMAHAVVALWPKIPREELELAQRFRRDQRAAAASNRDAQPHNWHWVGAAWQCSLCGLVRTSAAKPAPTASKCDGEHKMANILSNPRGHALAARDAEGIGFVVCLSCGAFGISRAINLRKDCRPRTERGKMTLDLIHSGRLPPPSRLRVNSFYRITADHANRRIEEQIVICQ
jgi:hypothetical protein